MMLEMTKASTPPSAMVVMRHPVLVSAALALAARKSDSEAMASVTRQTT
jgi:hypothetical protein